MDKSKKLSQQEILLIDSNLRSKQSSQRRNAAKKIGKFQIFELAPSLFSAYLIEKDDKRTWETQTEMIKALGRLNYKTALPLVKKIVNDNLELDTITMVSATAYIRLKRKTLEDVTPIYELFETGKESVLCGAVNVLVYDKIVPAREDIYKLIKIVNESSHLGNPGIMDTREVLANAMAAWPKEIVSPYLKEYKKIKVISNDIIDDALKGKTYYKEY